MSVRDIEAHLRGLYGVEIGRDTISRVTDAVLEDVAAWRSRPLEAVYPIVYFDAIRYSASDSPAAGGDGRAPLLVRDTCCGRCGGVLRVGREMVYRHTPRQALWTACGHSDPQYGPARRRGGNGPDPALDRSARHHAGGI